MMLRRYAEQNSLFVVDEYIDDGYSGTNFERPNFKRMIDDIEDGRINCVVTKDMSRLGREYLQVGQLMELYLPTKGVRFIAINDGVDSLVESGTDFNPIRNWANELHTKDTSKKVRAVKKLQVERGERLSGRLPYGYRKKSSDSKEIVPDEETAPIVQCIFQLCAGGKGPNQIARILTEEQILTSANYAYRKAGKSHNHVDITRLCDWSGSSVTGILNNMAYLGHTVGLRSTPLADKNKKLIRRPEDERITVENTHPALVSEELWDIVQDVRQHKKRIPKQMEEPNIFSGLAFCADCGKPIVLHRASTMKRASYNFKCCTYGKRDGELSMLFKRLYEDHVLQRITAEQFRMLSAD